MSRDWDVPPETVRARIEADWQAMAQAATIETAECTPVLRWRNGVLQQKWMITAMEGDPVLGDIYRATSMREEWRDVPQVRE